MQNEQLLSGEQSLEIIHQMINQAKNRFSENGFLYLLWGWLILICSVVHFILLHLNWFSHPEIIWASCWVAIIFQVIFINRKRKKEVVRTYSENIVKYIWISFSIAMFILFFLLIKNDGWEQVNSLFLMLYGIPTFLSGVVMQFKPLRIGGLVCWGLAVLATFLMPVYGLLLLATAMIAAWIVPGYLLRKKYNQQNNT